MNYYPAPKAAGLSRASKFILTCIYLCGLISDLEAQLYIEYNNFFQFQETNITEYQILNNSDTLFKFNTTKNTYLKNEKFNGGSAKFIYDEKNGKIKKAYYYNRKNKLVDSLIYCNVTINDSVFLRADGYSLEYFEKNDSGSVKYTIINDIKTSEGFFDNSYLRSKYNGKYLDYEYWNESKKEKIISEYKIENGRRVHLKTTTFKMNGDFPEALMVLKPDMTVERLIIFYIYSKNGFFGYDTVTKQFLAMNKINEKDYLFKLATNEGKVISTFYYQTR